MTIYNPSDFGFSIGLDAPAATEIMLADLAAWETFAEANREALVAEHGSVDEALRLVREGGLEMGGGAAPLVVVYFADGEAV